jgi:3-oxoacyl-[acyl-carrier protein] reductase
MGKLLGKKPLVTAGAQGIGLAISRHLLAAGCDIAVHYRSSEDAAKALAQEAQKAGRACHLLSGDLTEPEECERVGKEAVRLLGGLDVLMNNAGSLVARKSLADSDDEFWAEVMSINLGSARRITRAVLPALVAAGKRGGASIVNLSSLAGRKGGGPGSVPYATAKGAIVSFTRTLALELGPQGVRVNALAPGLILGSAFHATHTPPEAQKAIISGIPLGRAGTTDEVAKAAVFFAEEYDGFITAAVLDINGGVYAA